MIATKPEKNILLSSLIDNFSKFKRKLDYQLVLCNIFLVGALFESVLQKLEYHWPALRTFCFACKRTESKLISNIWTLAVNTMELGPL